MGVYQGSKNRNQQAGLWGDFPIVNMRSFFSNVVSVFSFIGFVTYLPHGGIESFNRHGVVFSH